MTTISVRPMIQHQATPHRVNTKCITNYEINEEVKQKKYSQKILSNLFPVVGWLLAISGISIVKLNSL